MRNGFKALTLVTATAAALVAVLSLAVRPIAAQAQNYRAPRLAGTQNPDLNGVWQAVGTANWDIQAHGAGPALFPEMLGAYGAMPGGQGIVEGNEIPYRPEALAKKRENFEKRLMPPTDDESNNAAGDPEAKCYLPGVPRATYMAFPFHVVQTASQLLIAYEFNAATRTIHLGRKPDSPAPSWMGWSIGRWEGDTLVVDVTDQVDKTWFDRAGNYHSDALHVVERYTPMTPHHLMYEATIDDPKVFTRPWKMSFPLYRRMDRNAQLIEFKCVEFAESFVYGRLLK